MFVNFLMCFLNCPLISDIKNKKIIIFMYLKLKNTLKNNISTIPNTFLLGFAQVLANSCSRLKFKVFPGQIWHDAFKWYYFKLNEYFCLLHEATFLDWIEMI